METASRSYQVRQADRNFKGPFYTLRHVRYRLKRDTGVLERGLGSVSGGGLPKTNSATEETKLSSA